MLKILLIRPGTTEFDEQGRILGTLDVPLSEQGSSEISDSVDELRLYEMGCLYTAAAESARRTAERNPGR